MTQRKWVLRNPFQIVPLAAAGAVLVIAMMHGTHAAAAADAYGYVSQADLIARGSLRVDQSFARSLEWTNAHWAFVPPGYTLSPDRRFLVPQYPTGLPLVMGGFERITGRRDAVFLVVPLFGALAVWMTGWLGARLHRPATGAIAAVLMAASPVFLYQVLQPASDVPAMAWWTTCLALAVAPTALGSLGAGAAASMAILTRPNFVPLAAVVGAYYLWRAWRRAPPDRRAALTQLALFVSGAVPGCLAVGGLNWYLHGSPLTTGYPSLDFLFGWENPGPNLDRYPRWLWQTQTPLIFVAFAAPVVAWMPAADPSAARIPRDRIWLLFAFIAAVIVPTFFYGFFGRDEWVYLRLLLPAFPPLIVLSAMVVVELIERFTPRRPVIATAVVTLVTSSGAAWQINEAVGRRTFDQAAIERRYVDVGRQVAAQTPANAVVIAGVHAGSIRYYSGRLTINVEYLDARALDRAIESLRGLGFHPLVVLEDAERAPFRAKFGRDSLTAALDWPPRGENRDGTLVGIWDPADRLSNPR